MMSNRFSLKTLLALISIIVCSETGLSRDNVEALSSTALTEEIISNVSNPHAFDWRKTGLIFGYGAVHYMENNSFESSAYQFSIGVPMRTGSLIRAGFRRVKVSETHSSVLLAKTPFTQSAQSTRFEFFGNYGLNLLEGRSISIFSPSYSDLETVLWVRAGLQYSHPNQSWYPKPGDKPEVLPAQEPVNSKIGLELGILWQLFFPNSLGLHLEAVYHYPIMGAGQLRHWTHISMGVSVALGVE